MTTHSRTLRSIAFASTAALGAGVGLVTLAAPAQAASLTTTYECDAGILGTENYSATITVDIPASVESAAPVAARPITVSVTIPDSVMDDARALGVESLSATSDTVTYRVGPTSYPVTGVSVPDTEVPANGSLTVTTTATATGFTAPAPGVYPVRVPASFTLDAVAQTSGIFGEVEVGIACALDAGAPSQIATVEVTGDAPAPVASTTAVKVTNGPITTATKAKLGVNVKASGASPTGKVTAKLGKRTLASANLKQGKVTLTLPKLTAGSKKVVVSYAGSATVKKSKKSITIMVKRP